MTTDALRAALAALDIGLVAAVELAARFHVEMAGYKPERHAAVDADVEQIGEAIAKVSLALAQPEPEKMTYDEWMARYFPAMQKTEQERDALKRRLDDCDGG